MTQLPPKPNGCLIEEIQDFDRHSYIWEMPSGGNRRYFLRPFVAALFAAWAFGMVFAVLKWLKNDPLDDRDSILLGLRIWMVLGNFIAFALYRVFQAARPEVVTLSQDMIEYDPGRIDLTVFWDSWITKFRFQPSDPFQFLDVRSTNSKPIAIPITKLNSVRLERVGAHQRLYLTMGSERIEIGKYLRDSDREWLASVIGGWKS